MDKHWGLGGVSYFGFNAISFLLSFSVRFLLRLRLFDRMGFMRSSASSRLYVIMNWWIIYVGFGLGRMDFMGLEES